MAGAAALLISASQPALATVKATPASGTPQLATTGTTEQIRQLVQCGQVMYAVGSFTKIERNGTTFARNNIFSFSAVAPYTVTAWNPNVNGVVNSIAFRGGDCSTAYIGGTFSSVHGTSAANIAAISTSTGAVQTGFAHSANGQVETLVSYKSHLLVGGYFTAINGNSTDKYMVSLSPVTGRDDRFIRLHISGHYQFCDRSGTKCSRTNNTHVYNQQLSRGGTLDLVEGDFTSVGGQSRQQIFMLNLAKTTAAVTGWTSAGFYHHCAVGEPFYIRGGAWSPNDATVYIASTGFHPINWNGQFPLTGLCDVAAAFPAAKKAVKPTWINYTGCDSLYSVAAGTRTVYFGGHERWSQNPNGCNNKGPGGISAPGMEGLSPSAGRLIFNPTRSRGLGAHDMLLTAAGLWIASDNFEGADMCGGVSGHAGICFLPF
jgi:hypothetical protein